MTPNASNTSRRRFLGIALGAAVASPLATVATGQALATPAGARSLARFGYFSVANDNAEIILDTDTGRTVGTITGLDHPANTYVTPNGSKVFVDNWGTGEVVVIDAGTRRIASRISLGGRTLGALTLPRGADTWWGQTRPPQKAATNSSLRHDLPRPASAMVDAVDRR